MPGYQTRQTNDGGNNTSDWQKMLAMYTLAGNNDANTMLGFALGKLLNQAWMDHIDRLHTKEFKDWQNGQQAAKGLAGQVGIDKNGQAESALGEAGQNPWAQSYAQNYNDKQFSDALAKGVQTGKVSPEFAQGIATGGWNVGNSIPDYLKQQTAPAAQTTAQATQPAQGQAVQGQAVQGLLGNIAFDPNTRLGKMAKVMQNASEPTPLQVANEMAGNGNIIPAFAVGKMWNSYTPKNNTYTTGNNFFSMS